MQIALIDDDVRIHQEISLYIQNFADAHGIPVTTDCFESGSAFLDHANPAAYSLFLIDIYLHNEDGLALAEKIRRLDPKAMVCFLTSSPDHMPSAFAVHAFDYLLKPVGKERIFALLEDVEKVRPVTPEYIEVSENRRRRQIELDSIVSAVSDGHYLGITYNNGMHCKPRMTVAQFLELVHHDPRFFIINKGIVINADYIDHIQDHICHLQDGSTYPTRIRDFQRTEKAIQKYQFEKIRARQRWPR